MTKKNEISSKEWVQDLAQAPFEEAMARLDQIVAQMEDSQLPLEEAMQAYEEGVYLIQHCQGKLNQAQAKIEMLEKMPAEKIDKSETNEKNNKPKKVRKKKLEINEESGEPILASNVQGSLLDL